MKPGPASAPPCGLHREIWRRLAAAADDRAHPMRLQAFATVDTHGSPDARILMLRGAHRKEAHLWYYTDTRTRKVTQIRVSRRACVVCYDPRDGTQIRIWGEVAVHCDDDLAHRHWEQLDLAVRRAYALPNISGCPLPHPDLRMRDHSRQVDPGAGRAHFAVLELHADAIEWLQIKDTGDERTIMRAARGWEPQHLVP